MHSVKWTTRKPVEKCTVNNFAWLIDYLEIEINGNSERVRWHATQHMPKSTHKHCTPNQFRKYRIKSHEYRDITLALSPTDPLSFQISFTRENIYVRGTHTHNVRRFMFLWCISVICIAFSIPNIQLHNEESVNCSIIDEKKKKKSFDLSTFFPLILKKFR